MFSYIRRFVSIGYFRNLLYSYFASIENLEGNIEVDIEDTKISEILGKRYIGKTF